MSFLSLTIENFKTKTRKHKKSIAVVLSISLAVFTVASPVYASDYSAQIQQLQDQNAGKQSALNDLKTAALPLQQKIANLQATINGLTDLINKNQTQRDHLSANIASLESQISSQRAILKQSIRQMYIQGEMSTVEILASSKNLSDYVDREQYTLTAQTKVKKGMDTINNLENQQKKQRQQVDQLLGDSKKMQDQINTQKDQVNKLLADNQSQQDSTSAAIASNNAQITDLERKQAAENAQMLSSQTVSGGGVTVEAAPGDILAVNGYDYPWAGAPWPNDIPDPWGMDQRQCVSYTAWAVSASGRHMPYWGGSGNANQWPGDAESAGIPVDHNPRAGDVAISMSGTYGHAMYVNSINSDGSLNISQYNADWTGQYSEARIDPGSLLFIHF